jgi:L-cysteine:1D-myo-inositol 2-amino-2-deoxy-alpha-D-glucopyranoside ligase
MYVCGITPYDATHLGHAATYLAFDLVHRVWRDNGHSVQYVQNVTDIDDPLLERAQRDGEDWTALGKREIARFRADMEALRVLPPNELVGVVEAIPEIVDAVGAMLTTGAAYRIADVRHPDVYFDHRASGRFGYLSQHDLATMIRLLNERRGDPYRPGKRHPLDPLLWRTARAGEPAWPSRLGPGRPGWHVECSTIAVNRLGMSFDIQGGGPDLSFPHHEFSAAHAEALTGQHPFARHYCHTGAVMIHGKKMSKSSGNLIFISRLREDVDPLAIRLALLAGHYRSDRSWTAQLLAAGVARLRRWRRAATRSYGPPAEPVVASLRHHLASDLDTPAALATVDAWADEALRCHAGDPAAPDTVRAAVDALLGVEL